MRDCHLPAPVSCSRWCRVPRPSRSLDHHKTHLVMCVQIMFLAHHPFHRIPPNHHLSRDSDPEVRAALVRTKAGLQCYIRDSLFSPLLFFACSKDTYLNFWTIDYFCIRVPHSPQHKIFRAWFMRFTDHKHLRSALRKVSKGVISQATADQMSDLLEMSIEKSMSGCSCKEN